MDTWGGGRRVVQGGEKAFHALSVDEVEALLGTSVQQGLSEADAAHRLSVYGLNRIEPIKPRSWLVILLDQVRDPLILILLAAGVLSFFLAEVKDSLAILAIILLTILVGFFQEFTAEKAVQSLKKLAAREARVIREGKERVIPAEEVVPGDLVVLGEGDIIPADARVVESFGLTVDESMLTGESLPVRKRADPVGRDAPLAERASMVYAGTAVTSGSARVLVTRTARETELGRITEAVRAVKPQKTPLQVVFEEMSRKLSVLFTLAVGVVFILFILNPPPGLAREHVLFQALLFSLSLAIAVVPSSLPPIVTISLSLGAKRLAERKMLVKRLPAAETLGSVSVICTDKTGTLTKNEMTVTHVYHPWRGVVRVTGRGYEREGRLVRQGRAEPVRPYVKLAEAAVYCNNASYHDGAWHGDPTEIALKVFAYKILPPEAFSAERVREFPFSSERKMMSVIVRHGNGVLESLVKGAPEVVLEKCSHVLTPHGVKRLSAKDREVFEEMTRVFASKALRVLALAGKRVKRIAKREAEEGLVLYGLVGMIDPPREDVPAAVRAAREAGIRVVMITGDNPHTARAVGRMIGLVEGDARVLTGREVDGMSDAALRHALASVRIIARSHPLQKLRIVRLLQEEGHIVAVTGDGVNDAPALRKADIGIAMGSGTDVAKDVSHAILLDDNFASIIRAIEEGRNIYDKIVKSTRYLLSCNMAELVTILTAVLMHLPLPLLPIQLLLMNLFTDGLPAFALTEEPPDRGIMRRPPRARGETPLNAQGLVSIFIFALILAGLTLGVYVAYVDRGVSLARTMAFTSLVFFEMAAVLGSRSLEPFGKLSLRDNPFLVIAVLSSLALQVLIVHVPFLQGVFHTTALGVFDWALVLLLTLASYVLFEMSKLFPKLFSTPVRRVE